MFIDSATGAFGGGMIGPVMRVGSRANKVIKHSSSRVYQVGAGAVEALTVAGYVSKPMISRPVRMELIAGGVAGMVYDIAYGKSSGSRSEQNGPNVGSGGTSSGPKPVWEPKGKTAKFGDRYGARRMLRNPRNYSCPPGWRPAYVNGKMVCIRR